jgi:hypothetical protein
MLKKAFLYRIALHELKNCSFPQTKKFFVSRKLYELHSKALSYAQKLLLYVPFFAVRKYFQFLQTKSRSFAQTFFIATQSNSFPPSAAHFNAP